MTPDHKERAVLVQLLDYVLSGGKAPRVAPEDILAVTAGIDNGSFGRRGKPGMLIQVAAEGADIAIEHYFRLTYIGSRTTAEVVESIREVLRGD